MADGFDSSVYNPFDSTPCNTDIGKHVVIEPMKLIA